MTFSKSIGRLWNFDGSTLRSVRVGNLHLPLPEAHLQFRALIPTFYFGPKWYIKKRTAELPLSSSLIGLQFRGDLGLKENRRVSLIKNYPLEYYVLSENDSSSHHQRLMSPIVGFTTLSCKKIVLSKNYVGPFEGSFHCQQQIITNFPEFPLLLFLT